MYAILAGPVIVSPTKIGLVWPPARFWYTAKLWGMPESLLSKFTVTAAPAGTLIVFKLNALFWAIRSIVTDCCSGGEDEMEEDGEVACAVVDVDVEEG